ncbi:hypothetical protein ABW19_dt0208241 [Dactylella cylindrospora]|nr:hypothetical protein ABW19_dt0208241 [Dactylella cylindrospora]
MFEPRYTQRDQGVMHDKGSPSRVDGDSSFPRSPVFTGFGERDENGDQEEVSQAYSTGNTHHAGQRSKIDSRDGHIPPMDVSKIDKRKMKRFRLTHNQTRYLMSEFARQAHPDAAHRERLSREIPGLSPRQVQVWFQNRRAKLKRMSSDDRDRMMRSRALPDEFPLLQTLHSYGSSKLPENQSSPVEQYTSKPADLKPLGYHGLPRHMASEASAMGTPQNSSYAPLPFSSPRTIGGLPSPISTASVDRPSFPYLSTPTGPKPSRGNPFSSPPSREVLRPQSQSMSQPSSVPRAFPDIPNLSEGQPQTYSPPHLNSDNFSQESKGYYMHNPQVGIGRSIPGLNQPSYMPTASASITQPYPSPHKPAFSPPLNLVAYKYQMPMTPHTAGTGNFSEQAVQESPELVHSLPQQLSAPPDATTFSTSYLTPATSTSSYSQDGFMSPKTGNSKDISFGRWYGHRSRRSCSHPPEFLHTPTAAVS